MQAFEVIHQRLAQFAGLDDVMQQLGAAGGHCSAQAIGQTLRFAIANHDDLQLRLQTQQFRRGKQELLEPMAVATGLHRQQYEAAIPIDLRQRRGNFGAVEFIRRYGAALVASQGLPGGQVDAATQYLGLGGIHRHVEVRAQLAAGFLVEGDDLFGIEQRHTCTRLIQHIMACEVRAAWCYEIRQL